MSLDIKRIESDLRDVLTYIDEVAFHHELSHELLRVGEFKVCTEFLCESVGDNAIVLLPVVQDNLLKCARLLNLDDDYIRVVENAAVTQG